MKSFPTCRLLPEIMSFKYNIQFHMGCKVLFNTEDSYGYMLILRKPKLSKVQSLTTKLFRINYSLG